MHTLNLLVLAVLLCGCIETRPLIVNKTISTIKGDLVVKNLVVTDWIDSNGQAFGGFQLYTCGEQKTIFFPPPVSDFLKCSSIGTSNTIGYETGRDGNVVGLGFSATVTATNCSACAITIRPFFDAVDHQGLTMSVPDGNGVYDLNAWVQFDPKTIYAKPTKFSKGQELNVYMTSASLGGSASSTDQKAVILVQYDR